MANCKRTWTLEVYQLDPQAGLSQDNALVLCLPCYEATPAFSNPAAPDPRYPINLPTSAPPRRSPLAARRVAFLRAQNPARAKNASKDLDIAVRYDKIMFPRRVRPLRPIP